MSIVSAGGRGSGRWAPSARHASPACSSSSSHGMRPQREMLVAQRRTLEEKRLAVERAQRAARRLPALETAVDELDTRLARLRARLPARRDAAELLLRLETAATRSGLTIRAFVPRPAVERSWYAEWPIRLELTGTYQRLGLFLRPCPALRPHRQSAGHRRPGARDAALRTRRSRRRAPLSPSWCMT